MTTLYKILGPNGESIHGGDSQWFLPKGKRPGKWMPKIHDVLVCSSGYHLVEGFAVPEWWRQDCTMWVAEGRGDSDGSGGGKTAFAQARLVRQVALGDRELRLFAADCAEHVLHLFEERLPNDGRPRKAIEAARAFTNGLIDARAARAAQGAARDAARAAQGAARAAQGAAWVAQGAAQGAAWVARAAQDAAWVARDAARATQAAWVSRAAQDAARDAEHQWQSDQLATYLTDVS